MIFLILNKEKSFNELLNYYFKDNNFGYENKKKNELCKKCNTFNLEYYKKLSTLPDVLFINLNLHSYYENKSENFLKEDSFFWALQEEIS